MLIFLCGGFMGLSMFFATRAVADGDKVKSIAYQANKTAENALDLSQDLKIQIADVRGAIEVNRREYREDRIRDAAAMQAMEERIIRAMNKK